MPCVFCDILEKKDMVFTDYYHWFTIFDGFPITEGHMLIIPKRHIQGLFDMEKYEWEELYSVIRQTKKVIDVSHEPNPDGYNFGVNSGIAAGQTVPHLHLHVIPRYKGDCEDPRGGIRWIMPEKAKYW